MAYKITIKHGLFRRSAVEAQGVKDLHGKLADIHAQGGKIAGISRV